MPNIGPMELAIVFVIALLILGPKRLPDAGRSLGQGLREFKDGLKKQTDELSPAPPRRRRPTSSPRPPGCRPRVGSPLRGSAAPERRLSQSPHRCPSRCLPPSSTCRSPEVAVGRARRGSATRASTTSPSPRRRSSRPSWATTRAIALRRTLGLFATGVTVITTLQGRARSTA